MVDDIRLIDLLRRHQAKATFNLNPGLHQSQRSFSWRYGDKKIWRLGQKELPEVYTGFEIANHSFSHPNLPDLSPTALRHEVQDSRTLLQDWFQQPAHGFCYPFGGFDPMVKAAVHQAGHRYARTVIEIETLFPPTDPFEFGVSCRFNDPLFWSHYEHAKASNGVFLFWGHSYELIDEAMWAELEYKIARINTDSAAEWVNLETLFLESDTR